MNHHATPYKQWQSPISLEKVFGRSSMPAFLEAKNDCLYWMQQDPTLGGITQIKRLYPNGKEKLLTSTDFNVRTRSNEYGGKAFCIGKDVLFFCNDKDQRIYRKTSEGHDIPQPITVANAFMYADLCLSKDEQWLFFVMETPDSKENITQIGVISATAEIEQEPHVLVSGADFYASITLSADNKKLAWIEWNHPNMPWDETCVVIADLSYQDNAFPCIEKRDESLYQAICSQGPGATIAHLSFVQTQLGSQLLMSIDWPKQAANSPHNFAQLYLWNGQQLYAITKGVNEYSYPHWIYSNHRYVCVVNDDLDIDHIIAIASNQWGDELHYINLVNTDSDDGYPTKRLAENFVRFTHITEDNGTVYVVADSALDASQVLKIKGDQVAASPPPDHGLSEANISCSSSLLVQSHGQDEQEVNSHAFYYPPKNIRYSALSNEAPPLIVMVHGGPTARAQNHFDIQKQFWTSSGFAVLDVNHRGSTGFGRSYRDALLGQWGVADAEDIFNAIQLVIQKDLAHTNHIFIRGKSAGGYAVQRALTLFPDVFAAGASYYGIGDLATLASITHKFEAYYCDQLLGEVFDPETAKSSSSVYFQRSPIHSFDQIKCPLILFQGMDDKVVPPELSQQAADAMQRQGIEYEYHQYSGEGHGFRSLQNQVDSLSKELLFYRRQMQ